MGESRSPLKSGIALEQRIAEIRAELQGIDPAALAARTGAQYHPTDAHTGVIKLRFWGRLVAVAFPCLVASDAETGDALDVMSQAILAYYFHDSDGTPQAYRWIAFSELPDAYLYTQAFQGYTGGPLLKAFGNDAGAFETALQKAGGERLDFADIAYAFQVLPQLAMMVVCWRGDEDFPSSYRILFDASTSHHFSTDGCAILGSMLTRKVIQARSA